MFTRVLFPIALSKFRCTVKVYLTSTPFVTPFLWKLDAAPFWPPLSRNRYPLSMTNKLPSGSVGVLPLASPLLIREPTVPLLFRPSENPPGAPFAALIIHIFRFRFLSIDQ